VEIYCEADSEIRKQRFVDRNESGKRHPGHVDRENYDANAGTDFLDKYPPIEISNVMYVDTTSYVDIQELAKSLNVLA
jgi:hypothetical protein